MRVKFLFFLLLVTFGYLISQAQSAQKEDFFSQLEKPIYHQGEVTIKQDENLKGFIALQMQKSKSNKIPGYRIIIFRDANARQAAFNARARFQSLFPDQYPDASALRGPAP